MTKDGQTLLPVIQADRDAAASCHTLFEQIDKDVRSGKRDAHPWVQGFARHRLAFSSTPSDHKPDNGVVERLRAALERDRSIVAMALAAVGKAIEGRAWLREAGRGSYAYDDERYQEEFGGALDEISAALDPMRKVARDWSDCPTEWSEIIAARTPSDNGLDPVTVERAALAIGAALGEQPEQYHRDAAEAAIRALSNPVIAASPVEDGMTEERAAIERCAKVVEARQEKAFDGSDLTGFAYINAERRHCAAAIRAMAPASPSTNVQPQDHSASQATGLSSLCDQAASGQRDES